VNQQSHDTHMKDEQQQPGTTEYGETFIQKEFSTPAQDKLPNELGIQKSHLLKLQDTNHVAWLYQKILNRLTETKYNCYNMVHAELVKSRINRDSEDLNKLIELLDQHNPFNQSDDRLCSISSGVIASDEDEINCDQADKVVEEITTLMDNKTYTDITLTKSNKI
jgi:hypothetical protein